MGGPSPGFVLNISKPRRRCRAPSLPNATPPPSRHCAIACLKLPSTIRASITKAPHGTPNPGASIRESRQSKHGKRPPANRRCLCSMSPGSGPVTPLDRWRTGSSPISESTSVVLIPLPAWLASSLTTSNMAALGNHLLTPVYLKLDDVTPWPQDRVFYLLSHDGLMLCRNDAFFSS